MLLLYLFHLYEIIDCKKRKIRKRKKEREKIAKQTAKSFG